MMSSAWARFGLSVRMFSRRGHARFFGPVRACGGGVSSGGDVSAFVGLDHFARDDRAIWVRSATSLKTLARSQAPRRLVLTPEFGSRPADGPSYGIGCV